MKKDSAGFDLRIVLMHCKILESFKGTKWDWMKSLKAFCTQFERYLFALENRKVDLHFLGLVRKILESLHIFGAQIVRWVTWSISSFEFHLRRLLDCNCWLIARKPERFVCSLRYTLKLFPKFKNLMQYTPKFQSWMQFIAYKHPGNGVTSVTCFICLLLVFMLHFENSLNLKIKANIHVCILEPCC